MSYKDKLDTNNIPSHVAIIMDGNGRWAKKRNKNRIFGHKEGTNSVKLVVEAAYEIGVKHITLYAFSTENWNRPKTEISGLMSLLVGGIKDELDYLHKQKVKLTVIGDDKNIAPNVKKAINKAIEKTKNNTGLNVIIALSYSSRWEILNAVNNIIKDVADKKITQQIDEQTFSSYLTTANIPDPELLIRTSGEIRISNFLLWQISYSELYFTEKYWPDFKKEEFFEAIYDYQNRERRFGKTSEQITKQ